MDTGKDEEKDRSTAIYQENPSQYLKELRDQKQTLGEQEEKIREHESELIGKERAELQRLAGATDQPDYKDRLMGLAFSGGGIRSATFNLGVLQALSEQGLLTRFDYLSTVSGGGYIGSWLSAWIWREREQIRAERLEQEWKQHLADRQKGPSAPSQGAGAATGAGTIGRWISDKIEQKNEEGEKREWLTRKKEEQEADQSAREAKRAAANVQQELADSADARDRKSCAAGGTTASAAGSKREPDPITFLRNFSNYLTPKLGLLSYDTLAAVATYARNLLLNQTILVLALASLLLLPRAVALLADIQSVERYCQAAGLCLVVAIIFINLNLIEQQRKSRGEPRWFVTPSWVLLLIVVPLVLAAMLTGFLASVPLDQFIIRNWLPFIVGGLIALAFMAFLWIAECLREREQGRAGSLALLIWNPLGLVGCLAAGVALLILLHKQFAPDIASAALDRWSMTVWGMPAALGIFALAVTLQLGITGRPLNEDCREWWGRLGGALIGIALGWITLAVCALYSPYWVILLRDWVSHAVAALGVGWIVSTVAGVLTALSSSTGKPGASKWIEIVPRLAPYIFVAGLLVALSHALYIGFAYVQGGESFVDMASAASEWTDYTRILDDSSLSGLLLGAGILLTILTSLFLSWRVDVNVFSLHRFYLNRLERCYLGASNRLRRGNPFTGFDPRDSVRLAALVQRPYPIINTAINLTHSKRLAWQERKAASFMFTPRQCGYVLRGGKEPVFAYQPTAEYATGGHDWIGLARAFAVSGAAVSPNMGYHSTPAVAFLLTVFNVRLGLWMENPANETVWKKSYCLIGLYYLLCELLGASDEEKNFVYLSDGGHFENLGIYELVRRRCRFIVASDASMDGAFSFDDLGNAVRKCRIDLGIPIEIDTRAILPDPITKRSQFHCAVGIIHYEHAFPGESPGYLLYIKPSLAGNEPTDVIQYATAHPEFPHESTGDQWFAESQFESYRRLGYKIARTVLAGAEDIRQNDMESIFDSLKKHWYPPSSNTGAAFSKHGDQLKLLQAALRQDKHLEFLDAQIFPEWPTLMQSAWPPHKVDYWLPTYREERRAGFYFCANLLQLMENVYLDLNLQNEYDHPDNRGWMNLFRHWSWSGMFRVTYAVTFSTYGARFQQFCNRHLDLAEGQIKIVERTLAVKTESDLQSLLETAEKSLELNFLETELIRLFHDGRMNFDTVIPQQLSVMTLNPTGKREAEEIQYAFGFSLALEKKLVYFRVQDHLRSSGLARKALDKLYEQGYSWLATETGQMTPYEAFIASLTPEKLEAFKQRYGDNPVAFRRLFHSVEKERHRRHSA
jgi:hypothetical protein